MGRRRRALLAWLFALLCVTAGVATVLVRLAQRPPADVTDHPDRVWQLAAAGAVAAGLGVVIVGVASIRRDGVFPGGATAVILVTWCATASGLWLATTHDTALHVVAIDDRTGLIVWERDADLVTLDGGVASGPDLTLVGTKGQGRCGLTPHAVVIDPTTGRDLATPPPDPLPTGPALDPVAAGTAPLYKNNAVRVDVSGNPGSATVVVRNAEGTTELWRVAVADPRTGVAASSSGVFVLDPATDRITAHNLTTGMINGNLTAAEGGPVQLWSRDGIALVLRPRTGDITALGPGAGVRWNQRVPGLSAASPAPLLSASGFVLISSPGERGYRCSG